MANFNWLSRFGWAGVDMFFVLSGFLIGTQILRPLQRGEGLSIRGFYLRRAWRILPAFAVVLALYVAFPALREAPGLQPWWQFATFTMNFLIDYSRNQAFSHAWSLGVEAHFYLIFPLLAIGLARRLSAPKFLAVFRPYGTTREYRRVAYAVIWIRVAGSRWRLPGASWIATVSYSLYLSHKVAFHLVHEYIAPPTKEFGVFLFIAYALAALVLGCALHYLVERPCLRLSDRRAMVQKARHSSGACVEGAPVVWSDALAFHREDVFRQA